MTSSHLRPAALSLRRRPPGMRQTETEMRRAGAHGGVCN